MDVNILKELANIVGMKEDEFNNLLKDATIKYTKNGKPVVDIEKGVDKLNTETKEVPVVENPVKQCTCENKKCTDTPNWISKDVLADGEFNFILIDKVNGISLADCQTELEFSHNTEDGWVSGITDQQLLTVLLYRFRNDTTKFELIKRLF